MRDDAAAIAVLTGAVLSGLPNRRDARAARAREIERWIAGDAVLSLSALAAHFDVSYRQLARITGEDFGCSPRLLQMNYRALKVAVALSLGDESVLAPERVEESFYDQSHLISNFQRFVGTTPVRFLDENATLPIAALVAVARRRSLADDAVELIRSPAIPGLSDRAGDDRRS